MIIKEITLQEAKLLLENGEVSFLNLAEDDNGRIYRFHFAHEWAEEEEYE